MASNNNQQNGWLSGLGIGFGNSLSCVPEQQQQQQQPGASSDPNQYEQLDRSTVGSNTLKVYPIVHKSLSSTYLFFNREIPKWSFQKLIYSN